MKRLLDAFASLRLTIGLLVAIGALLLAGLWIPQQQVLKQELYTAWQQQNPTLVAVLERLELTDLHRSPIFVAVWLAFFANLTVVMARRLPATRKRARIDGDVPDPRQAPGFTARAEIPLADATVDDVASFFARRGYAVHARDGRLRAVRWRLSPWATLAFHVSFFLVAVGGVASFYTRFEGVVDLGEGEQLTGDLAQYAPTPRLPRVGSPPQVRATVEHVAPEVVGDYPVGIKISVRDDRMLLRTIEVNRPAEVGDAAVVFKNVGVAPLLIVHDADGREVFGGYFRLNVLQRRKDGLELVGIPFEAELFPDYFRDGEREASRSQEMRDPVLRLTATAPDGTRLQRSLRVGESMIVGPHVVTFADWRYWVRLYVRSERGIGLIWAGFALAAVALAYRLVLYRREFVGAIESRDGARVLAVAGRADYYRALFADEAQAVERALREAFGTRPTS